MVERKGRGKYVMGYLMCPDCESDQILTTEEDMDFPWGDGKKYTRVILTARVPVRTCQKCHSQWTDSEAEDIITRVAFRHEQGVVGIVRTKFASAEEEAIWREVADELSDPRETDQDYSRRRDR